MDDSAQRQPGRLGEPSAMRADLDAQLVFEAELGAVQAKIVRNRARLAEHALAQSERIGSRVSRERDLPLRSLSLEVAMASHQHDRSVQKELSDAWSMLAHVPATIDALQAGSISLRHANVIHDIALRLADADVRGAWESVVLDFAAAKTPAQTKAYAIQLAERVDPAVMQDRHDKAAETREVSVVDLDDGMALLLVRLPATIAYAVKDRLRRMAGEVKDAARAEQASSGDGEPAAEGSEVADVDRVVDTRTIPQIEADLVADLLLTGAPAVDSTGERLPGGLGSIRGHVQVIVPVTTLTGTTHGGAMLNGQIPIDPATAKHFAGTAKGWDRVMCDPITGTVLATDRYTPRTDQIRYLRARDQHCRMPGCRQPAIRCQIDHNHEHHDGGKTRLDNLAHFCIRHHTLKTETAWTVQQLPGGRLHFHSPLGRRYEDDPPPRVIFVPDPPPY